MAEKLSVQIALDGGAEIEKQLANIGAAGQKAFADISKSAQQVGFKNIKPEEVTTKLQQMGVTGVDAINKIQQAVQSAGRLETLVQGVQAAETALMAVARAAVPVGVAIGAAMVAATKATISFSQSITETSAAAIKLGVSFQEFDAAKKVLEALGLSVKGISSAFTQVKSDIDRIQLEQVTRDAEEFKRAFKGGFSGAAEDSYKRLREAAQQFTPAGDAAAKALQSLGRGIPGISEADIKKLGLDLARLKALAEKVTGKKITIDADLNDPIQRLEVIKELLEGMPDSAQRTAAALRFMGEAGGTEFIQQLKAAEGSLSSIEQNAIQVTGAVNRLMAAFNRFGSVSFGPVVVTELNAMTNALNALQAMISNFSWSTFTDAAIAAGNALKYFSVQGLVALGIEWVWNLGGFDALIDKLKSATQALLEWLGLSSQAGGTPLPGGAPIGGPGGGIGSNAAGGLLGGRGTGTSDSNLAWVSRGEYITPARAVAQPGVLGFLEALRRSGGNLSRVLDGMGRFALGGLVPRMPAFATGGLAGGSHVTIQFPGLPAIGGLRASSDVVEQLHRAAALAQVRSGGRKPSRYA